MALRGLVVVMDIRHPLKDYDRQMLGYAVQRGLPAHVLLTKADKLGRGAAGNTLQAVRRELSNAFGDPVRELMSVVVGKRVLVRVDLGGGRCNKKKTK